MTVLQHILACDVERTALLKEMEEIINEPEASEAPTKKGKGKKKKAGNNEDLVTELSEPVGGDAQPEEGQEDEPEGDEDDKDEEPEEGEPGEES